MAKSYLRKAAIINGIIEMAMASIAEIMAMAARNGAIWRKYRNNVAGNENGNNSSISENINGENENGEEGMKSISAAIMAKMAAKKLSGNA
jgi:hypothetical protein